MARTVAVKLEADVGGFIPPVEASEKATAGLNDKVKDTDESLKKIPADAAKAAAAMKLLGADADGAGGKLQGIGEKTKSMDLMTQRIQLARIEVKRLGEEFNRTGDVDIFAKLRQSQIDLRVLEDLRKKVAGALEQGAVEGGKNMSAGLQGGLSTPGVGPVIVAAIVGAVLAAAAPAGAALNAALIAGVGLGGIAAGIAGQINNPLVREAFAGLANRVGPAFHDATSSFAEPLVDAAKIFAGTFDAIMPSLKADFGELALLVRPLAAGLQGFMINFVNGGGFSKAIEVAGPILMELARLLPSVGRALSDMFSSMSGGVEGAKEGLRFLILLLDGVLRLVGWIVEGLSKVFDFIANLARKFAGVAASITSWIPGLRGITKDVHDFWSGVTGGADDAASAATKFGSVIAKINPTLDELASKLSQVAMTQDLLAGKMVDKLVGGLLAADHATLGWEESLTHVSEAITTNGKTIDIHTAKGQANREAVLSSVEANLRMYDSQIASGVSAVDAAAAYDQNTAALQKQLEKAGLTKDQIDGLIGKYRGVPKKVDTDIAVKGLTEAINDLDDIIRRLNGLGGRVTTLTVEEVHRTTYVASTPPQQYFRGNRWGGVYEKAAVGLLSDAKMYTATSPGRYMIAEPQTGGEAFVPRRGDYGRSTQILDQAARWYGGRFAPAGGWSGNGGGGYVDQRTVTYVINDASDPTRVVAAIKRYEQSNGKAWRNG